MSSNVSKAILATMVVAVITFVNFKLFVQPTLVTYDRGYQAGLAAQLDAEQNWYNGYVDGLAACEATPPPSHGTYYYPDMSRQMKIAEERNKRTCESCRAGRCLMFCSMPNPEPSITVEP